ncbi:PQQ-like domain-containing protein [Thamnidium elegans]|nr:PQQ-like domain-containing protein [Thamnidium elegans]
MPLWTNEKNVEKDIESIILTTQEFSRQDLLICATHGAVYGIHKKDGTKLWKTKIQASASVISVFVTDNDKLIVGAFGKTYCLSMMTGEVVWKNKMPGFGYGEVSVISTPSKVLQPPPLQQEGEEEDRLPPNYDQVSQDLPIVISCSEGKVMAINIETGETSWTYNCPGGWYNIPVAIVEPSNWESGRPNQLVYIGAGKWVYCLNARTGNVIWSVQVSTARLGYDFMTLATPWSSRLAAESHSAFSQNPVAQYRELQRAKERS